MIRSSFSVAMIVLTITLFACSNEEPPTLSVTVMSFNLQNLFDNRDDPGKDDKAYLPIEAKRDEAHIAACNEISVDSWRAECLDLDWSDLAIEVKLTALAGTIRQVNGGKGADIIALQEVENLSILEQLRTDKLADLGYQPAVLIEGADARGIDVARRAAGDLRIARRIAAHRIRRALPGALSPDPDANRGIPASRGPAGRPARRSSRLCSG